MPRQPSPSIESLIKQIRSVNLSLKSLGKRDLAELLRLIRKPGWTTPAEWAYTKGSLNALQVQIQAVEKLRDSILTGSRAVGRK